MPDWTPPPDVVFDHQRARQLIDDAQRVVIDLRGLVVGEEVALARARRAWVGRVRDEADETAELHHWFLQLAMQRLHQLMAAMDHAVEDATREQARRRELREEWEAECRAERTATDERAAISAPGGAR